MSALSSAILPQPAQEARRRLEQNIAEQVSAWHRQWLAEQYCYLPPNIRFTHDPHWRNRWFSVQAAADGKQPIWATARIGFAVGAGIAGAIGFGPIALTAGTFLTLSAVFGYATYLTIRRNGRPA